MWIIVATVLLLYLLGFLFICYLNAEKAGNPSTSDNNNSISASNSDETENLYHRHYRSRFHRYHRLFLRRLMSSSYQDDEEQNHHPELQQLEQQTTRQGRNSSDPSRSSLFAYRQQQLRQIHHEINEMSYLLGTRRNESDQRARSFPVPILSRSSVVQPLGSRTSSGSTNYCNTNNQASRYSFIHQLMSSTSTAAAMNTSSSMTTGDSANANNVVSTPGGSIAYHSCASSSLSYSPSGSESCHIFRERQRRLRRIRMELEGLSLQLSNVDDRSASGMTPLHGAATTTSSLLMMSVSPSSAGTTFGLENNLGDSSSLIYFPGGNTTTNNANGNSWSDDDDLPGYEECSSIVCLVDSPQQQESPPPSYNEAAKLHLYSFGESGVRKK
ncbi:unnamed protein product [Orchesella dallaii]|uniref:Uncharacterized protein n=1 Tax=Orchesella dallaii TaxID=48710 RepID=A0ABP1QI02_9HEXA